MLSKVVGVPEEEEEEEEEEAAMPMLGVTIIPPASPACEPIEPWRGLRGGLSVGTPPPQAPE